MTVATPLSVSGRWIIDANGRRVKLAGVNWVGAHQDALTPGGLDRRHRDEIAGQIAAWGFNSVRLPFAVGTVTWGSPVASASVAANPDLVGATAWEVYTACVRALTSAGLMVIPNCHLLFPGWCCSEEDGNGLWWNENWPASKFTGAWQTVAASFAGEPLVIGYDLANEPRRATLNGKVYTPSWGDGNPATDFRQMYSSTATSMLEADVDALFFCEGLSYAADLTGVRSKPVTPAARNRVVYSMHDYSWFHPAGQSQGEYTRAMENAGGFLLSKRRAPVWIGEFGTDNDGDLGGWFGRFLEWAARTDVDWCWWHLDGTMCQGTVPRKNHQKFAFGDRASYGLFNPAWTGPSNPALLEALQSIQPPTTGPETEASSRRSWFGRRAAR